MIEKEKIAKLIKIIQESADVDLPTDDQDEVFDPQDWSGGNFDDAYSMGCNHGETQFARTILYEMRKLGIIE